MTSPRPPALLERFRAKWIPVRVRKTRQNKNRAFRARFGITPHQSYDMVRRKDTAALAAQAERFGFEGLLKWIKEGIESGLDRTQ
jgi:hypothetical protein